jgi:hypothetical protein
MKRSMTIEDLVQAVQDCSSSDPEVVTTLSHLFATRRVRYARRAPILSAQAA